MNPILLLSRIAYGFNSKEVGEINKSGTKAYIESQLNPDESDDPVLNEKMSQTTFEVEYESMVKGKMKMIKEEQNFKYLNAPLEEIWKLHLENKSYQEKIRPGNEVRMATLLRAIYSKWHLKEMMAEFWHNHFNINIDVNDKIAMLFPIYDREVIRKNCFGNFRTLIENVAKNPCMLYYLDNFSSKASPSNENYARELFELHTLGAGNYLNDLYNRWREVPGALEGNPAGYIDEDVYEAARAFTGWTVADGSDDEKGGDFPNTGQFHYYEGWHDNYQKRVLATEFSPNQRPLADGLKVLDLVAYHPGTARFICTKLCKRFVSDEPPESLIVKTVKVWTENQKSPDQIKMVLKTILLSEEFESSLGQKLKRPNELLLSLFKSIEADVKPNAMLYYFLIGMGYHLYSWPTPTGHPDSADYWLNTNMMLLRWKIPPVLIMDEWHKITKIDLQALMPQEVKTCKQITDFWIAKLLGERITENTRLRLTNFFAVGGIEEDEPLGTPEEVLQRLKVLVALIATSPEFQYR